MSLAVLGAGCTSSHSVSDDAASEAVATALPSAAAATHPAAPPAGGRTAPPRATPLASPAAAARAVAAAPLDGRAPAGPDASHAPATAAQATIYSVNVSPTVVRGGQSVIWDVRTSPDIVSVSARTTAVTLPLSRVSAGHFALTFAVPQGVPFFFHRTYVLDVEAVSAAGTTAHRNVTLTFM